jgi:hypothetical protein
MISIAIPSRKEVFLNQTIRDVLSNATGEIEVFPILDGYEPDELIEDPRVTYIRLPVVQHTQKRHGINQMAVNCQGDYLMSLDAHCMVAKGFDEQLVKDHQPDWVQIPRRNRLDAENWCIQKQSDNRPPIDYEHTMWPMKFDPYGLHGFRWDARTLERIDIPLDDTMHFQGSCWFMTKEWFNAMDLMQIEGYSGWGQEAEEIGLKTWRAGGRVITNKNTWYAHLHKGPKYGRMYWMSRESIRACNRFSYQYWVHDNKDFFVDHIEKFWPVPGWPRDWKKRLYE